MSDAVFCKTRYQDIGYASYNDFWKLVELAGYPIIYVDQIDPQSDNTYIVTPLNDEWMQGWQNPKARIIHYELEWRWDWRASVNEPPGVSEVWAADKAYAERIGARYIPMGSDDGLNVATPMINKDYDVAQIAYQTGRRDTVTNLMHLGGLRLAPCENLWGVARSSVLNRSEVMLHVHQTEQTNGVAPLRWCLAASHHLPLISETIPDRGIFGYTCMITSDYTHLAGFTAHMLKDKRLLADYAAALNNLLCHELTFRKSVEAAL